MPHHRHLQHQVLVRRPMMFDSPSARPASGRRDSASARKRPGCSRSTTTVVARSGPSHNTAWFLNNPSSQGVRREEAVRVPRSANCKTHGDMKAWGVYYGRRRTGRRGKAKQRPGNVEDGKPIRPSQAPCCQLAGGEGRSSREGQLRSRHGVTRTRRTYESTSITSFSYLKPRMTATRSAHRGLVVRQQLAGQHGVEQADCNDCRGARRDCEDLPGHDLDVGTGVSQLNGALRFPRRGPTRPRRAAGPQNFTTAVRYSYSYMYTVVQLRRHACSCWCHTSKHKAP